MKILIKIIKIEFHICSDVLKVDLNLVISIIQCNFFILGPFSGNSRIQPQCASAKEMRSELRTFQLHESFHIYCLEVLSNSLKVLSIV